ncbi:MAG: ABC transporter permease [Clostridiaceae bacterium]|nr:ABC transporter permease [Clostridiaceae bacterium]
MANNEYENKPLNTDDIDSKRVIREDFVSEDRSDALDDEARIKVLSPTMLVMKRFFRNKLAIAGLIIIASMFLFAFVGGLISPYGEDQRFYTTEEMMKDFASGSFNKEYKFDYKSDITFSSTARANFVLALNKKETTFIDGNHLSYFIDSVTENFHKISELVPVAENVMRVGDDLVFTAVNGYEITDELKDAIVSTMKESKTQLSFEGKTYVIKAQGRTSTISVASDIAIASKLVYDAYEQDTVFDYNFKLFAETAFNTEGADTFTVNDVTYRFEKDGDEFKIYKVDENGEKEYAKATNFIVSPSMQDMFLSIEFKEALKESVLAKQEKFISIDDKNEETEFKIYPKDNEYLVKNMQVTRVLKSYSPPSSIHWLGTDRNGMDILTRLMYGGRVSLIIGFIVIAIEIVIGVILGGIAGYFSGWVDNLIMRIVDIFNCIPVIPLIIILGSVMDKKKVHPTDRILWLMVIMGILGWPGIARMVRGQILSLREQEFMIAAEATGLTATRRIFRHLVPNVIPQLIVLATMGLGSIILTESTLSFLGIGVKFPYASWGNIINDVTDIHVLKNYWFVWIPAGFLILITVMGFNFIGDGLRDAFDPKMKR